jgi:hypothetical protein
MVQEVDFGRCPCSGTYEQRWVAVRMTVDGQEVVMSDIPQGTCATCGSRVYKADVLEMLEALWRAGAG